MTKRTSKRLVLSQWLTQSLAVVLIALHLWKAERFDIDAEIVGLVALFAVAPMLGQLRRFKWGDFEAEIDPSEAKAIEVESRSLPAQPDAELRTQAVEDELLALWSLDPSAAVAKLRISLERHLARIVRQRLDRKTKAPAGIGRLVTELTREGVIGGSLAKLTLDVAEVCNRVVHGAEIDATTARSIVESGLRILSVLEDIGSPEAVETRVITIDQRDRFMTTRYVLETVVPLADNPEMKTYNVSQTELENFLEGYHEYAEFMVRFTPLPADEPARGTS